MNRSQRTCGTITKDLTFMPSEEEDSVADRIFKEILGGDIPNLVKDINLWIQEVEQSPPQKINPKHIIIKFLKTNYKKILESSQR